MQEIKLDQPVKKETPQTPAQKDYAEGQEFLKNKELSMAANAFHNALIGFQKDNDQNGIANSSDKLGDICLLKDEFEKALAYWETTYDICEKASDRMSTFSIVKKRAKLYLQWQQFDKAIELHLEMLDEYSSNNNPQGSVDTLEAMSEIYLAKGDKSKAVDCLRTAAGIHKNFNHVNFHDRLMQRALEIETE